MAGKTHTFTLKSGVEVEIKRMKGKHGSHFENQQYVREGRAVIEMLADELLVRIGSNTTITKQNIRDLNDHDVKQILVNLARFDRGFPEEFTFDYTFELDLVETVEDAQGKSKDKPTKKSLTYPVSVKFEDFDASITPMLRPKYLDDNPKNMEGVVWEPIQCSEYEQVLAKTKAIPVYLPEDEIIVYFDLRTLGAQEKFAKDLIKRSTGKRLVVTTLDVLTAYSIRRIVGEQEIPVDLKELYNGSIKTLATFIKKCQGEYDTEVEIENPLYTQGVMAEGNQPTRKFDLTTVKGFLFESSDN